MLGFEKDERPSSVILNKVTSFKEFTAQRKFNFVRLFCGARDVLGEAITRMATLQGIQVRVVSLDRELGMDLLAPQPFNDFLELARTGEVDARAQWLPLWKLQQSQIP